VEQQVHALAQLHQVQAQVDQQVALGWLHPGQVALAQLHQVPAQVDQQVALGWPGQVALAQLHQVPAQVEHQVALGQEHLALGQLDQ